MTQRNDYAVIILAAGSSTRMGTSKQLLPINEDVLLVRTAKIAIEVSPKHTIVVLGHQENRHREALSNLQVEIVSNPRWQSGIGSTLKAAVSSLQNKKIAIQGIIVLVCDQPYLTANHLLSLMEASRDVNKGIVASRYNDVTGVPVLFSQKYFPTLLQLADIQGAKVVIEKNPHDVALIDLKHGEIDLDTPEDYQAFLKQNLS